MPGVAVVNFLNINDISAGTQTNDIKITLDSEKVILGTGTDNIGDVDVLTLPNVTLASQISPFTTDVKITLDNETVDIGDRADRLLGIVYGSNAQLKQTATNNNLQVELATGGTLYDARQIRALTNSDIVKSQLQDNAGNGITSQLIGSQRPLDVLDMSDGPVSPGTAAAKSTLIGGIYTNPVPTLTSGQQAAFQLDSTGSLKVTLGTTSGTPIAIIRDGVLATNAIDYYEYVVPVGKTLRLNSFYTGGVPSNSASGAVRAGLYVHDTSATSFITTGDFEVAGDVTAWAAVSGAFTAPSPDVSSVQFVTGASSMRWIYTASATAHTRRYTPAAPLDLSTYRYLRVRFYNDAQVGTTRTISIILTSGTSTRTYSLAGTLGTAPFTSNSWVTLTADLESPTSSAGTTFDITSISNIQLSFIDGANRAGTIYWDTLRLEDSLLAKHKIFSSDGTTVSVITSPEAYMAGTTLYLRTKNTNNGATEFATCAIGSLE